MSVFKQPLVHFLLLGAIIFFVFQALNPDVGETSQSLKIDRDGFIDYLRYRNKGINQQAAEQLLAGFSEAQQARLAQSYIKEQVLYHQALKLGLDKKDYVIKQRLVQKLEYLLAEPAQETPEPSQAELEQYYQQKAGQYFQPALASFTHVFVDSQAKAQALQKQLNDQAVPFENAPRFGQRFIYYTNYIERDKNTVASHFGNGFADALFSGSASNIRWQGPFQSDHGWHVVLMPKLQQAKTPTLAEVYPKVLADVQAEKQQAAQNKKIAALMQEYGIDAEELVASLVTP